MYSMISTMAWKLARGDKDLRDDLEQEAAIALLELDPSEIRKNPGAAQYYRAQTAMQNLLRRERRRKKIESLYAQGALPPRSAARRRINGASLKKYGGRTPKDASRLRPIRRNTPRHPGAGPLDGV